MTASPDDQIPPTNDPSQDQAEQEEDHWPTTNELIAQAHKNRVGETYPDAARLLENLPIVLRGLCDFVLSGQATAYDVAIALASLIDAIENVQHEPEEPNATLH